MLDIDVLLDDAFSAPQLTQALEDVPYVPTFLDSLNLFEDVPITTDVIKIEKRGQTLRLVPTTPRGAPVPQRTPDGRTMRAFATPRLANGDRLKASEIFGVRAFGSTTELETVAGELLRRLDNLRADNTLTHEYHRLGAIQGLLVDSDGSTVIEDFFAAFGISTPTEIDFNLDAAQTGSIYQQLTDVQRTMIRNSGGLWGPGASIGALAGDAFYDALIGNAEIRTTYLNQVEAQQLRKGVAPPFGNFTYGPVTFFNYRGTDDNSLLTVPTDKVKFFPIGVRGVFQRAISPGETLDDIGTLGRPVYAMQVPDLQRNMWVDAEVYSYVLYMCTRPQMLLTGKRT